MNYKPRSVAEGRKRKELSVTAFTKQQMEPWKAGVKMGVKIEDTYIVVRVLHERVSSRPPLVWTRLVE